MNRTSPRRSGFRSSVRSTIALAGSLVALVGLLVGPGSGGGAAFASDAEGGSVQETFRWIVVVRHAEKASEPEVDPPLTPEGEQRAEMLRRFLQHAPLTGLFATELRRSEHTLAPLAQETGLLITIHDSDDPFGMAERVLEEGGPFAVVSAHSDTVLPILHGLTGRETEYRPPILYHDLFLVALAPDGSSEVLRLAYGEPDD